MGRARVVSAEPRRGNRTWRLVTGKPRVCVAAVVLLAVASSALSPSTAVGQDVSADHDVEVRIVARRLASGRVEFALQQRTTNDTWGARQFPRTRFFPTTAAVDRWLASSPLTLTAHDVEVRIVARRLASGRVEFALQQRTTNDTWGARQFPRTRFFPTTAAVDRWLASSPLTLTAPEPSVGLDTESAGGDFIAVSAGSYGLSTSCGVRTDGTITCWGNNTLGQANAPEGRFSAVAAGQFHSCGVRTDGTITCWGHNSVGQAYAPEGRFSAVAVGRSHSCGVRTDGTITCWGHNTSGQANAPEGRFSAVSAGSSHSCGVRTDGTITCWGDNGFGRSDAPEGRFSAVSAGSTHSCGVRTDRTVTCWGRVDREMAEPAGRYSAISGTCGLRTDGSISCWSIYRGLYQEELPTIPTIPPGPYSAISGACALRTDGAITCWGLGLAQPLTFPASPLSAVSMSREDTCGLRTDGTITCWGVGIGGTWPKPPPAGRYSAVAVNDAHSCGLRTDGTITCWSRSSFDEAEVPEGRFSAVSAGVSAYSPQGSYLSSALYWCGLRTDGTITCWGRNAHGRTTAPAGQYTAIDAGAFHSCGLRTDGTITCWGYNYYGQATAPEGRFSAVSAGAYRSCALRTDGTMTCWGRKGADSTSTDLPVPPGQYSAVSAGNNRACGLRTDGIINCIYRSKVYDPNEQHCWALDSLRGVSGEAFCRGGEEPASRYSTISLAGNQFCAVRTDGAIECSYLTYFAGTAPTSYLYR